MKRLQTFLSKMSLTKQLIILTLFTCLGMSIFLFVYMSRAIDIEVDNQSLSSINRIQDKIKKAYSEEDGQLVINYSFDPTISHVYYNKDTRKMQVISEDKFSKEELDIFQNMLSEYTTNNIESKEPGTLRFGQKYLYQMDKLDDNSAILTFVSDDYSGTTKSELSTIMVYTTFMVIVFIFFVLLIWLLTILQPISRMQRYMIQRKDGQHPTLEINREDELGKLMEAIVEMDEELDRQDQLKQDMLHNISHDLKTPISTIKSYAESIKDGIYPYGTLEKSIDVISENATRLEKKVHNLLYMNRVEYLLSQDENAAIQTNVKSLIETVVMNAASRNDEIHVEFNMVDAMFRGNKEAWQVAIENLFENSLRYAKSRIKFVLRDGYFSITNDGPKMDEDRVRSLFRPFEKGEEGQFGLGLSIVYKIAVHNGYGITGENIADGVRFRIYDLDE